MSEPQGDAPDPTLYEVTHFQWLKAIRDELEQIRSIMVWWSWVIGVLLFLNLLATIVTP